jgi:subtilisin family serine protease
MFSLKRVAPLLIVMVLSVPALAGARPSAPASGGGMVEVIVTVDGKPLARGGELRTLQASQRSVESELAARVGDLAVQHRYSTVLNGLAVTLPESELSALESTDGVTRVYPNVAYHALRSSTPSFIGAPALWGPTLNSAGNGVKIGIIDDGLDKTHPYFRARGYRMPRGFPKGRKAYTSAKVVVARAFAPRRPAWKYAGTPFDPINSDHATHVAGIAAGNYRTQAQGGRISGIAPKAYLGNYKVLTVPTGGFGLNGNSAEIVAGIEAAVRDGMDVINLSLGEAEIEPSRDIVAAALDGAAAAGVVPVVAAGNNFEELGAGSVASPGSSDRAITVAAESEEGGAQIASFSSGGPTPLSLRMKPDVTAPGVEVMSSVPRREGLWASFSGTSMAAPHVAGAAALLHQRHRSWSAQQIKSALVQTGKPVLRGGQEAETTREGGGTVDLVHADTPLLFASPSGISFGHVPPGGSALARVTLSDAGGGAGPWASSTTIQQAASGVSFTLTPVTVPGELVVTAIAAPGATQGTRTGFVELTRGTDRRRIPFWLRVSAPALAAAQTTPLTRTGTYKGNTQGRPALVETYRYPEDPRGFGVPRTLFGPEQVFRVHLRRRVANFGVAVTGGRLDVQPRVVRAGDENRLLGEIALPYNANPYLSGFGAPMPVVGAALPAPGDYDIVFDTVSASRAGRFTFRFWMGDTSPPHLRFLSARGGVVRVRARDAGAGVNPSFIRLVIDGRLTPARYLPQSSQIVTTGRKLRRGRHVLRLVVSDYQELKNMENVRRILPNTAGLRMTFLVP